MHISTKVYQESTRCVFTIYRLYFFILNPYFFRTGNPQNDNCAGNATRHMQTNLYVTPAGKLYLLLFNDPPK
jgi:hypothetical protein